MYLEVISFPKYHPIFSLCRYITLDVVVKVIYLDVHSVLKTRVISQSLKKCRFLFPSSSICIQPINFFIPSPIDQSLTHLQFLRDCQIFPTLLLTVSVGISWVMHRASLSPEINTVTSVKCYRFVSSCMRWPPAPDGGKSDFMNTECKTKTTHVRGM